MASGDNVDEGHVTDQEISVVEDGEITEINAEQGTHPKSFISRDKYQINTNSRVKVIVLNHTRFKNELNIHKRIGTNVDKISLQETFKKLNFDVVIKDDLKKPEIIKLLKTVRNTELGDCDCFILVVLTHGSSRGRLQAADKEYDAEELWKVFIGAMPGKPKLFIIQACRGCSEDSSSDTVVYHDGPSSRADGQYTLPGEADILISYFLYKDHVVSHDENEGSKYVQELCHQLNSIREDEDVISLLTKVSHQLAIEHQHEGQTQMSIIQSTLIRRLLFANSPVSNDDWKDVWLNLYVPEEKLPPVAGIFCLGKLVKQFLARERLDSETEREAKTILFWLSEWPDLYEEECYIAFKKLQMFIVKNEACSEYVFNELQRIRQNYSN